jgi:hypothetical protein
VCAATDSAIVDDVVSGLVELVAQRFGAANARSLPRLTFQRRFIRSFIHQSTISYMSAVSLPDMHAVPGTETRFSQDVLEQLVMNSSIGVVLIMA